MAVKCNLKQQYLLHVNISPFKPEVKYFLCGSEKNSRNAIRTANSQNQVICTFLKLTFVGGPIKMMHMSYPTCSLFGEVGI